MGMSIEDTRTTTEARTIRELNLYLSSGWKLLLTYVEHANDTQQPRFVLGWQSDGDPVIPELLDEWELHEIDRQRYL
jgi:hypothetical protein